MKITEVQKVARLLARWLRLRPWGTESSSCVVCWTLSEFRTEQKKEWDLFFAHRHATAERYHRASYTVRIRSWQLKACKCCRSSIIHRWASAAGAASRRVKPAKFHHIYINAVMLQQMFRLAVSLQSIALTKNVNSRFSLIYWHVYSPRMCSSNQGYGFFTFLL